MTKGNQNHDIDVVIPTKDRPGQLFTTLEALTRQSFSGFGVVVVDDGSRCEIEGLMPPALREALGVRFVRNPKSLGPGPARNRGVAHSRARYLILIDDDCVAGPDMVARHYRALAAGDDPVVSLGPILPPLDRRMSVCAHWDAYKLECEYARLASGKVDPGGEHFFTGNVGLRRADFMSVGGFDERFARGEDLDLGHRLAHRGCQFRFDPEALVRHDSQRTIQSWMKITSAAASSALDTHERNPQLDHLGTVSEQLFSKHWALLLMRRWLGGPVLGRLAILGAMGAGVLLHGMRADRLSFGAISVASDFIYWRSLQKALPPGAVVSPPTRIQAA